MFPVSLVHLFLLPQFTSLEVKDSETSKVAKIPPELSSYFFFWLSYLLCSRITPRSTLRNYTGLGESYGILGFETELTSARFKYPVCCIIISCCC